MPKHEFCNDRADTPGFQPGVSAPSEWCYLTWLWSLHKWGIQVWHANH